MCTANIARSPYAEARARWMLSAAPWGSVDVEVASAGVRAVEGEPMDAAMLALAERRGGVIADQRSRIVTGEMLAATEVVLTFEFVQHMQLLDSWPEHAGRIAGFRQFVAGIGALGEEVVEPRPVSLGRWRRAMRAMPPPSLALDVEDPFGAGRWAAARCADEIDAGLRVLLPFLAGLGADVPFPDIRARGLTAWWRRDRKRRDP